MSPNRKILGAAAFTLALTGGGVAGALLGTPSVSLAGGSISQSVAATATASALADAGFGGEYGGPLDRKGEGLAVAAKALGMSEADLVAALKGGKSIAEVAKEQGVDLQTVIDALVADGNARLDEAKAKLPDRITELVNRTGWGDHRPGGRVKGLKAAADAIGISEDDLKTALKDGSTLAEVATTRNVDVQKVIDALVAEATAKIDDAVASGKLDSARADELKANLVERITARVNGERPDGPGHGRRGPGGPDDATTTSSTPD